MWPCSNPSQASASLSHQEQSVPGLPFLKPHPSYLMQMHMCTYLQTHTPPNIHMCVVTHICMHKHMGICCIPLPDMYTQVHMLSFLPLAHMSVHTCSRSLAVFCNSLLLGSCLQNQLNYGHHFLGTSLCFPLPPAGNLNLVCVSVSASGGLPTSFHSSQTYTHCSPAQCLFLRTSSPSGHQPDLLSVFHRSNHSPSP